jgi:hypothetical protein
MHSTVEPTWGFSLDLVNGAALPQRTTLVTPKDQEAPPCPVQG